MNAAQDFSPRWQQLARASTLPLALLVAWQAWAMTLPAGSPAPSPVKVLQSLVDLVANGGLLISLAQSLGRVAAGFAVALVLGTALDGISMIVLTTTIVVPMIKQAGSDLVWFGIFVVLVVEMAEVSPPVGFNLFVLQTMSGKDSNTVARAALPFFGLLIVAVAIITVFPQIVMVLPRLAFPQ